MEFVLILVLVSIACVEMCEELQEIAQTVDTGGFRIVVEHDFFNVDIGYLSGVQYRVILMPNDLTEPFNFSMVAQLDTGAQKIVIPLLSAHDRLACGAMVGVEQRGDQSFRVSVADKSSRSLIFGAMLSTMDGEYNVTRLWTRRQGCYLTLSQSHGVFSFNHLRQLGGQGQRCTIILGAAVGYTIRLQFTQAPNPEGSGCLILHADGKEATPTRYICGSSPAKELNFSSKANFMLLISTLLEPNWFQAVYYSLFNNSCDEHVSKPSGLLTTPGYPNRYLPNLRCHVHVSNNKSVIRTIVKYVDIAHACTDNFVLLNTSIGAQTKLCHDDMVTRFIFESNALTLNYDSDHTSSGTGFQAEYTSADTCFSEEVTVSQNMAYRYELDFREGFNGKCTKTFWTYLPEHVVEVKILELRLTSCTEHGIYIFNGMKHELCGKMNGTDAIAYRSKTNVLSLSARSILKGTKDFRIKFEIRAAGKCLENYRPVSLTSCVRIYKEPMNWTDAHKACVDAGGALFNTDGVDAVEIENILRKENQSHGFWIGASDRKKETTFLWADGSKIRNAAWFPGWPSYGNYSRQPSDDGLAQEDCVELRMSFPYPDGKGEGRVKRPAWNDQQCSRRNAFICQIPRYGGFKDKDEESMERAHLLIREPFWMGVLIIIFMLFVSIIVWVLRKKYGISFTCCIRKIRGKPLESPKKDGTTDLCPRSEDEEHGHVHGRRRSSLQAFTNLGFRLKFDSQSSQDSIQNPDAIRNARNPAAAARFFASLNEVQQSSFASTATNDSDDQGSPSFFGQILAPNREANEGRRSPFLIGPDSFLHPDDALNRRRSVSCRWRKSMDTIQKSRSFDSSMSREDTFEQIQTRCVSDDDVSRIFHEPVQIFIESPSKTEPLTWDRNLMRSSSWRRKRFATSPQVTVRMSDSDSDDFLTLDASGPTKFLTPGMTANYDARTSTSDVTTDETSAHSDHSIKRTSTESTPRTKTKKVVSSPKGRGKRSTPRQGTGNKKRKVHHRKPKSKDSKDKTPSTEQIMDALDANSINVIAEVHSSPSVEHRSDDSRATSSSGAETTVNVEKMMSPMMPSKLELEEDSSRYPPRRSRPARTKKNPFKDSAYQTKDNSISKPTSTPLSPTMSCATEVKVFDIEPETIMQKSDPSYITDQLVEAAERLANLQDDVLWRKHKGFDLQTIDETADNPGYTCPNTSRTATQDSKQSSASLNRPPLNRDSQRTSATSTSATSMRPPFKRMTSYPVLTLLDGDREGYMV